MHLLIIVATTILSLSFLVSNMGIVIVLILECCFGEWVNNCNTEDIYFVYLVLGTEPWL